MSQSDRPEGQSIIWHSILLHFGDRSNFIGPWTWSGLDGENTRWAFGLFSATSFLGLMKKNSGRVWKLLTRRWKMAASIQHGQSSCVFSALASQDFLRQVYSRRFTKRGVAKGRRRGRILKSSSLKMSLQMASSEQNGRLAV